MAQLKPLAQSINQEPVFCGRYGPKVKSHKAGAIYLFHHLKKCPCLSGKTHCPTEKSRR
ncbi:hypothetical protein ACLK1T_26365 [Escherichia coli]